MDISKKEDRGVCSALKLDMSFGHEGGGDFALPDYMPEIQRLLYVVPTVLPETKFLSGNVLELGGTLTYSVLYLGDDGRLSYFSPVNEYSTDTALPVSVENVSELFADCEAEGTTCRVTGPRALSIKTRLRSRVMCDDRITEETSVLDAEDRQASRDMCVAVEKLTAKTASVVRCHGATTGSASGEITATEGERPVMCEGALGVSSAESTADGVLVKGDVYVKCLLSDSSAQLVCRKTKLPFEITVPVKDAQETSVARAWGRVASVSLTPSESEGSYSVSVEYDIEAETLLPTEVTFCKDAYSTDVESVCDTRECEILRSVCFGGGRLSVAGECELKNGAQEGRVYDASGCVSPIQIMCADGKLYASGTVKVKAVWGVDEPYCSEFDIPFKYELPAHSVPEGSELQSRVVCGVSETTGKLTGGKLSACCELSFSYEILERRRQRFVTAVRLGREKPFGAVGSGVKVYYPVCEESVWSVCKKYHASRVRIVKVNGIEGDTVSVGKPVIIF